MTPQMALEMTHRALTIAVQLSAPILLTAIVVGVVVNIFQTVTSIKDQSLTFIPKALAAALVLGMAMPWSIQLVTSYFEEIYLMLGRLSP